VIIRRDAVPWWSQGSTYEEDIMAWKPDVDGSLVFHPVEVAGDRLRDRVRLVAEPLSGTIFLSVVDPAGNAIAVALRPADVRKLGTAMIESGAIADPTTWP
jgi:hypothetical protein